MVRKNEINGIILAGGKSTRMGTDKALLLHKGLRFIERQYQTLNGICDQIIISSNNLDHKIHGAELIRDEIENSGPLAAICTSLKHSNKNLNIVLSCDIPLIETYMLEKLVANWNGEDLVLFKAKDQWQPLAALYHKSCLKVLENELKQGNLKLTKYIMNLNYNIISVTEEKEQQFLNINTELDYKRLQYEN